MIATCPACGKRYRIADDAVPAGGREVRCAACKHGWIVMPDTAAELTFAAPVDPMEEPALPDATAPIAPSGQPAGQLNAAAAADQERRGDDDEPAPRRRGLVVGLVVALILLALAAAAIVELAPADTFSPPRLGLPAVAVGALPPLDLTQVPVVGADLDRLVHPPASPLRVAATGVRRTLTNGTRVLTVTGTVANPTAAPVALAGIDAALIDPAGGTRFRWRIPAAGVVRAGGSLPFESVAANFPPQATVLRTTPR